jgi:hypothetical protein
MKQEILLAAVAGLLAMHAAHAQADSPDFGAERPAKSSDAWSEPSLRSRIGVAFIAAGGLSGFVGTTMRDVVDSDVGGAWNARVTVGSHIPIGLDVSYVGTAVDIRPVGAIDTGTLIGTELEAAVRWNILPHHRWNPYVFLGAGWQHYNITSATFSRAATGLADDDDLAVFPMGAGIAYRDPSRITFELRGTFRAASESRLLVEADGASASLDTWEASAAIGYEL